MADIDNFLWTYETLIHSLGINAMLGLSMYLVLACGQLSLGQAAFMGLGAYSSALLSLSGAPFWSVLPAAVIVPTLVAMIIGWPTLRLSGIYLAMATIAFSEILRIALLHMSFTGGPLGLSAIPFKANSLLIFSLLALAIAVLFLLARSRIGRAMEAMRQDELAASMLGVNLTNYKLAAMVSSAGLAGLAGALSAHSTSFISPENFGFEEEVTILSFALLGGVHSPLGAVLGAVILTALPEILRPLADFRMVINGFIIVAAVLFLPHGILPWRIQRYTRETP